MKKLTSLSILNTGEGDRIAFTYSEIDGNGMVVSQNNKGNFLIMDETIRSHANEIRNYIQTNFLNS